MVWCCGWSGELNRSSICTKGTSQPINSCKRTCAPTGKGAISCAQVRESPWSSRIRQHLRKASRGGTDPLVGAAEAAPVPVLCGPKEILEELEDPVGLQPLPVCLVELLEPWALHVIQRISPLSNMCSTLFRALLP